MKRISLLLLNSHSKDGNRKKHGVSLPSFPSDTLPKVYHEAVRGSIPSGQVDQRRSAAAGLGEPYTSPSSAVLGLGGAVLYSEWSNPREVTSHVGELGVMSQRAAQLREKEQRLGDAGADGEREVVYDGHPIADVNEGTHSHGEHHDHSARHTRHIRESRTAVSSTDSFPSAHGSTFASSDEMPLVQKPDIITSLEQFRALKQQSRRKVSRSGSGAATGGADVAAGVSQATGARKAGPRYSGVQLQILNLYRRMLKEVFRMRDAETRFNLQKYIRSEFDQNVNVPRKHVAKIEWCINTGRRKLEELQLMNPNTKFCIKR
ncbi:unnamed protein product [Phytomonas sp. EM1]|nr:unnamed protein product [Phytomonas sp. EM1]|eukprot:CCW64940.1 unnamed protein product [Phytomonas sp. isolate EM1]